MRFKISVPRCRFAAASKDDAWRLQRLRLALNDEMNTWDHEPAPRGYLWWDAIENDCTVYEGDLPETPATQAFVTALMALAQGHPVPELAP